MMIRNSLIPRAIALLALILKTTLASDNSTASAALAGAPANFSVDRSVSTASTSIKCLPRAWYFVHQTLIRQYTSVINTSLTPSNTADRFRQTSALDQLCRFCTSLYFN